VVDYVLQSYTDPELDGLTALFGRTRQAIEQIIAGDVRGAMTEFNRAEPAAK
jgi:peptidyl-tRNA hydrolase